MLGRFGLWLARGGAATFTIMGFFMFFAYSSNSWPLVIQCFMAAAIFYGIDQITTAIRELKDDRSEGVDQITAAIRESHQWWVDQESGESGEGDQ